MRTSSSIRLPSAPLFTEMSLNATTSSTLFSALQTSACNSRRDSSTNWPSRMAAIASNMPPIDRSVRNPSRPWLMPTRATSKGAKVRAMLSMVPSPPMTMASWAARPTSSSGNTAKLFLPTWVAVSGSSSTFTPRSLRNCARRMTGSAISGLLYLPISAMVLNVCDMARIRAHLPIRLSQEATGWDCGTVEWLHDIERQFSQRTGAAAAEDAGRTLYFRRPAGRFARARPVFRPGTEPGEHPQRHGGPGRARLHLQPAYFGGQDTDAARLPVFRRYAAQGTAARPGRDQPAGRTIAAGQHAKAGCPGLAPAVRPDAFRGCGDDAQAQDHRFPPHRIPEPVRETHPTDHRRAGRGCAEPHHPRRPGLQSFGTGRSGKLPEPELRGPDVRRDQGTHSRRTAPVARRHDTADDHGAGSRQRSDGPAFRGLRALGRTQPAACPGTVIEHGKPPQALRHVRAENQPAATARCQQPRARRADLHRRRIRPGPAGRMQRGDRSLRSRRPGGGHRRRGRPDPHGLRARNPDRRHHRQAAVERAVPALKAVNDER